VELIERDRTFWEVLGHDGRNYVSPRKVFIGEESMLWSAIFLDLLEHPNALPALLSPHRRVARDASRAGAAAA
jgi:hypothetical protein